MRRREAASNAHIAGDAGPLREMLTAVDPAMFMSPNGAVHEGAGAVAKAQVAGAAAFGPGSTGRFEVLGSGASGDLAYWTGRQVARMDVREQDEPVERVLRTTKVFRREDRAWRLVHRHADLAAPAEG